MILLCLKLEFLAYVIVMVYVGAIAVLFLFVSMMLNITIFFNATKPFRFESLIFIIIFVKFIPYIFAIFSDCNPYNLGSYSNIWITNFIAYNQSDLGLYGASLFFYFSAYTILISIILFVGMVGSISICLSDKDL